MKFIPPRVDYRKLRFNNLTTDFKHLWSLLYWVAYGIGFRIVEIIYATPADCKYKIYWHAVDSHIPFLEIFVIPYLMWFALLFLTHVYTLLYDLELYKKLIKYIMITYTTALVIFALFPNAYATPEGLSLRPNLENFPRQNFLVDFMKYFYANVDTPTNVCPSLHVVGTLACTFTIFHSKYLKNKGFRAFILIISVAICISTVFLKQHSVIDVIVALPISFIAEIICFRPHLFKRKKRALATTAGTTEESPAQAEVAVSESVETSETPAEESVEHVEIVDAEVSETETEPTNE